MVSVGTPQAEAGGAGVVLLATASLLRRSLPSGASAVGAAPSVGRLVAEGLSPRKNRLKFGLQRIRANGNGVQVREHRT